MWFIKYLMTHNNHNIPRCQAASAYDFLIGEGHHWAEGYGKWQPLPHISQNSLEIEEPLWSRIGMQWDREATDVILQEELYSNF